MFVTLKPTQLKKNHNINYTKKSKIILIFFYINKNLKPNYSLLKCLSYE